MEVAGNHFVELMVPFAYFAPQPISGVAGLVTVLFMGWLMLTGNFSWLNFLTGVLAVLLIPDSFFTAAGLPVPGMELQAMSMVQQYLLVGFSGVVLVLSYFPIRNMISSEQVMNRGFDPFRLVNTYGAFGSITRVRYELVIQGRDRDGEWKTYQFPGKPTDPSRCPPQWAPYHLRLDWQLWFAAMRHRRARWLPGLVRKLLENDPSFTHLLHQNPFEDTEGPAAVRMHRYRYEFTKPEEGWKTGNWWNRTYVDEIIPPTALQDLKRT